MRVGSDARFSEQLLQSLCSLVCLEIAPNFHHSVWSDVSEGLFKISQCVRLTSKRLHQRMGLSINLTVHRDGSLP